MQNASYYRNFSIGLIFTFLFLPGIITFDNIEDVTVAQTPVSADTVDRTGEGGPDTSLSEYLTSQSNKEEWDLDQTLDDVLAETSTKTFLTQILFGEEYATALEPTIIRTKNFMKVSNTTWPVDDPTISSDYGWRTAPCRGCSSNHQGVDFVPGYKEPIYAVADGIVLDMGWKGGYGYYVKMEHLMANENNEIETWTTIYAHMTANSYPKGLKIGSAVKSGEQIGAVGSTGMSTGPHLHFELLINGENVDPLPLLGSYKVVAYYEEDYADFIFRGETFKVVTEVVTYE